MMDWNFLTENSWLIYIYHILFGYDYAVYGWMQIFWLAVSYIISWVISDYQRQKSRQSHVYGVRPGERPLDQSNTFGYDNFANQISKEYPVSIIYGEYKHAGNRFYTEISGSHNNNNVLEVCVGIGEGIIEGIVDLENDLKLNDIPWKNITSSIKSYNLYTGTANQSVDNRTKELAITSDNNTVVPESGEVIITGINSTTTKIRLGLQAPNGLFKQDPNIDENDITYSTFYKVFGDSIWLETEPSFVVNSSCNILEFTECNYWHATLRPGNHSPAQYACGQQWEWPWMPPYWLYYPPGLTRTATIPNGNYTASTFASAIQIAMNDVGISNYTVTYSSTTKQIVISSDMTGGDGTFIPLVTGYQNMANYNSVLELLRAPWNPNRTGVYGHTGDPPTQSSFTFGPFNNNIIRGRQSGSLRWESEIPFTSPNRYELKVVNQTPIRDEFRYIDVFAIDYVNEYSSQSYTFPHLSYLALTLEANEQIGGSVPNITYIIKGLKVKNWDTNVTEWTDNPIWCLIDFMINARYGLGSSISITDIDLTSAIEAADYCDELVDDGKGGTEKRYILNIVIDVKMDPKEIISIIAQTCNLAVLYTNGKVKFKIDKPRTAVASFNMDNIVKGSFKVQKNPWAETKINRIAVQYQDKDNNYEREFAYKDDDTEQNKYGIIEKSIAGYGITRRSQALRQAQLSMNANRTITTTCSFQVGLENLTVEVMDNVLISHDITGWVGEEFTILEIEEEEDEIMTLVCAVYDESVYDFTTPSIADPLDTTLPNPSTATPHVEVVSIFEETHKGLTGDISTNIIINWQYPIPNVSATPFLNINKVEVLRSLNGGITFQSEGFASYPYTQLTIQRVNEITDDNRISNYSFEDDLGQWELVTTVSGEGTLSRSTVSPQEGQYSALINNISILSTHPSGEATSLILRQVGTFNVTLGELLGIRFKAKTQSGETRNIQTAIVNSNDMFTHYNNYEREFTLNESWQDYNFIFNAKQSKSGEIGLAFYLGQSNKDVYIDSVRLHGTALNTIKAVAFNEIGKPANIWTAPRADIVVIGKQIPPAQVANFSGGEYGNTIVLRWDDLSQTEYDLAGYEIRRGVTWNSGVIIDTNIVGTRYTVTSYRNGTQRYWIKAIDTSGNYSLNGSYIQINAVNAPIANIIYTRNELQHTSEATFSDTEMVWHEITPGDYRKCIALQTTDLYDETGDTWDSGVIYDTPIRTSGTYTTGTIDSLRLSTAQLTLDMDTAYLTTGGGVAVSYEIRTSEDNVVWSGWQTFAEGNYTFRYFQFRITWAGNGLNNLFIYKLILDIDVPEFVLRGRETIVTASAGASFTYSSAFIVAPTLSITVIGSTALIPIVTAESTTGATVKLKNLSDVDSIGTFDWTATGY